MFRNPKPCDHPLKSRRQVQFQDKLIVDRCLKCGISLSSPPINFALTSPEDQAEKAP